ncbi:MAG TPA: hypothetical protein DCS35_10265 [Vibrio sp.]|nr:hypothetical protein [Vibrio sp.]
MVSFKSNEELREYLKLNDLFGIDSEWSRQSLELVQKFAAKEMDINRWWVLTPKDWSCPCCKRSKPDIVRINTHGHLMGEIHEHHDHVGDAVRREFTKISEGLATVLADENAERFFKRIAIGFTAYDKTLVCSDCNEADWKAKELLGLKSSHFSFSPFEIGLFIQPSPNMQHIINFEKAKSTWAAAKPMFEKRMELIRQIAGLAATNRHWYQPIKKSSKIEEKNGEHYLRRYGLHEPPFGGSPESWLYKTNKHAGQASSWRFKQHRPDRSPSEGEVAHMAALKSSKYLNIPDDWYCDVCKRHKYECIRKSNSGDWNFDVTNRTKYVDGTYVVLFQFCKDCKDVAMNIGKEVKERDATGKSDKGPLNRLISQLDLSRVIRSQPHCKHHIENEKAERVIAKIVTELAS